MRIQHNIMAMDTIRNLNINENNLSDSLSKLSSGYRITKAADDAAGLAISNGMASQISSMQQAVQNSNDGINMIQTAEGSLGDTSDILQRLHDLATEAANGTVTSQQGQNDIQTEVNQLLSQIDTNAKVQFNGTTLNDGTTASITLQIGANQGDVLGVSLTNNTSSGLGLSSISLSTQSGAQSALTTINDAINSVSENRASLGAYQNRLQHTVNNLNTNIQNLQSTESGIRDVNMATEMANFTKNNILVQAANSMLAQANQLPQAALKILG